MIVTPKNKEAAKGGLKRSAGRVKTLGADKVGTPRTALLLCRQNPTASSANSDLTAKNAGRKVRVLVFGMNPGLTG